MFIVDHSCHQSATQLGTGHETVDVHQSPRNTTRKPQSRINQDMASFLLNQIGTPIIKIKVIIL